MASQPPMPSISILQLLLHVDFELHNAPVDVPASNDAQVVNSQLFLCPKACADHQLV